MRIVIDTDARTLELSDAGREIMIDLYSDEAFRIISQQWLRLGWSRKYTYTFTWFGRPVIQLPEDLVRFQEVVFRVKPDVIIETGVAHGGSLVFNATLCKAMGKGRVIGIDVEIRSHNREAIERHPLSGHITLLEGNSTAPEIIRQVAALVKPGETVLVMLDSNHGYAHVSAELEAYADFVTPGSYIVATDGIMEDLADIPRGRPEWRSDNPARAARDFAARRPEFVLERPHWPFNESTLDTNITHWPDAWLRRR